MLKLGLKSRTAHTWWSFYFLISDSSDFENNYLNAWVQKYELPDSNSASYNTRSQLQIFFEKEYYNLSVHSDVETDSEIFEQLRMFYRYYKVRRGFIEIIIPKELFRINCVKVIRDTSFIQYIASDTDS